MQPPANDAVRAYLQRSAGALLAAADDAQLVAALADIAAAVTRCFGSGGKLLIAGNGGSAADAQHIAGEIVGRFRFDRPALPAIALTCDAAVLTAVGNDYGFEQVFERQVRGLGRQGDVLLAMSTSGRSPNVLAAMRAARELGLLCVGFTGREGGPLRELCDLSAAAPSGDTPIIQQVHMAMAHLVCDLVEQAMFAPAKAEGSA